VVVQIEVAGSGSLVVAEPSHRAVTLWLSSAELQDISNFGTPLYKWAISNTNPARLLFFTLTVCVEGHHACGLQNMLHLLH